MNELSLPSVIEETKELLNLGRKVALKVSFNLYRIREESFAEKHQDFVSWCKQELDMNPGQISKYEKIADTFFAHGYTPESFLQDGNYRDAEVVYKAANLDTSLEEKFSTALTWNRSDFQEHTKETQPHPFEMYPGCKICGLSEERHNAD